MGIWDNIKHADHSIEKKIIRYILYMALAVGFWYGIDKLSDSIPGIKTFLSLYQKGFIIFPSVAIGILCLSYFSYSFSLDDDEAETKNTYKAIILALRFGQRFGLFGGVIVAGLLLPILRSTEV